MKSHYPLLCLIAALLAFTIFSPVVTASIYDDGMSSTHPMIDAAGSAMQGGIGDWSAITGVNSSMTIDINNSNSITIMDTNNDDVTDIIMQQEDLLTVYYIDEVTNTMVLVDSVDVGVMTNATSIIYIAPAAMNWNSTYGMIVTSNFSHMISYTFNGTDLAFHASFPIVYDDVLQNTYNERIVCSKSGWPDNDVHCFQTRTVRNVAVRYFSLVNYNVNDTTGNQPIYYAYPGGGYYFQLNVPKIVDVDVDGTNEVLYMVTGTTGSPITIHIVKYEMNAGGNITNSTLYTHAAGALINKDYSDILINNMDGTLANGYEISYIYSPDSTNFYARTISAAGVLLEDDYASIITAPEGDYVSRNIMDKPDCHSGFHTGTQAGGLVHDHAAGTTNLFCFTLYGGANFHLEEYTDGSSFTSDTGIISALLTADSTYDIAYENVIYDASANALLDFNMSGMKFTLPVDYFRVNRLDLFTYNRTHFFFIDDNFVNSNVDIVQLSYNTGNPLCNNTKNIYSLSVIDDTNDYHTCQLRVTYVNGTSVYNSTNSSGTAPMTHIFQYTYGSPTGEEAYVNTFRCMDQYNSAWESTSYSSWTSNTGCYNFGEGGGTNSTVSAPVSDAGADVMEDMWDTFGITSTTSRTMLGIGVVIGIMVTVAMMIPNAFVIMAAGVLTLIIVTFMGLVSAYILILVLVGLVIMYLVIGKTIGSSTS